MTDITYQRGLTPIILPEGQENEIILAFLEEELSKLEEAIFQLSTKTASGIWTDTDTLTAGEGVAVGDVCYLKSDGKMWKADASVSTTAKFLLAISERALSADQEGSFLFNGLFSTSGLTVGALQYLSETSGEMTETQPATSGSIVRVVGYAVTASLLYFNPDKTWIEV